MDSSPLLSLLPAGFWIVPAAVTTSVVVITLMGGRVMSARKKYGVSYPNMYATVIEIDGKKYSSTADGTEESAEKFNSAQRGHANALENYSGILAMTLVASLKYPYVAGISLLLWTAGAHLYSKQYASDGAKNRNAGFAPIKYLGLLGLLGANLGFAVTSFSSRP